MIEFPITIENGRCDLSAMLAFLSTLEGEYRICVKRVGKTRSNPQNRWLWGIVYPMLMVGLNDAGWEDITNVDQVHEFCLDRFGSRDITNKLTGEIVRLPKHTSEMNTVEFMTYADTIRDYARDYLMIEIPDPVL